MMNTFKTPAHNFFRKGILGIFLLTLPWLGARADEEFPAGAPAMEYFFKGNYQEALNLLQTLKIVEEEKQGKNLGLIDYWTALTLLKLQQFAEAKMAFARAAKEGFTTPGFDFQYGQVLYATQNWDEAKKAFLSSYKSGYKKGACLYYGGAISQLQGHYRQALQYYDRIEELPLDSEKVKKAALHQKAEVFLILARKRKNPRALIRHRVLPQFLTSYHFQEEHPLSPFIRRRIKEVEKEFKVEVQKRRKNGRVLPESPLTLRAQIKTRYDSNITHQIDPSAPLPTGKGSPVLELNFFSRYRFYHQDVWTFLPEFRAAHLYHTIRGHHDQYRLAPGLEVHYEHRLLDKMSRTIGEVQFDYSGRDNRMQGNLTFNQRQWTVGLGERWKLFSWGESTFKYRYKTRTGFYSHFNATVHSFSLQQNIRWEGENQGIIRLVRELSRTKDPFYDSDLLLLDVGLILPVKWWEDYRLEPFFSWMSLDPKSQKATRGVENTFHPSLKIFREFLHWEISGTYSYRKTISREKSLYDYDKHVLELGLRYDL